MRERLDYIDRAKGILIILMVIGHIWQSGYVHNVIYVFHMPAFFVISGMLLSYTKSYKKNYFDFLKRRIFAFGIPFLFIECLGILTDILRNGMMLNIKGYIYNTLILDFNDPNLWFIVSLFLVEVIFVLVKKLCKNDKIVIALSLLLVFISFVVPRGNVYTGNIRAIFKNLYYIYFVIGFYAHKILTKKNNVMILVSLALMFIVALILGKRTVGDLSVTSICFFISGLLGTYMVIQFGKFELNEKVDKLLAIIGKNTIIIYGTHRLYYSIVGVLLGITDYATTPVWAGVVMLLVVTILEVPTIYIINRWLPFLAGKEFKK